MTGAPELVCFADIGVDVVARVARLPRADEKQSATPVGEFFGGMGANAASAFATLGGSAALVSSVGDDERPSLPLRPARQGGGRRAGRDDRRRHLLDDRAARRDRREVARRFSARASAPQWDQVDWSVLEGVEVAYTVGAEGRHARRLFGECRRRGVTTALDVETADLSDEPALRELLAQTDLLFAPAGYARVITGAQSLPAAARRLLDTGPSVVAITAGERGCVVAAGAELTEIAGHAVAVVDTTGAGDCFAGAFLYGFVRGWAAADCARVANLMAAQSVTAHGCRGRLLDLAQLAALPAAAGLTILR